MEVGRSRHFQQGSLSTLTGKSFGKFMELVPGASKSASRTSDDLSPCSQKD